MAQQEPIKDQIHKLIQTIRDTHRGLDGKPEEQTTNWCIIKIWLKYIYLNLLQCYDFTPEMFHPYEYSPSISFIEEFQNPDIMNRYIAVSQTFFKEMRLMLMEEIENLTTNRLEKLKHYYMEESEKPLNETQWDILETNILTNNKEISEKLEVLPQEFMEALQLQFLFGICVLSTDFKTRLEVLSKNKMLFAPRFEGDFQNFVLFRGFNRRIPTVVSNCSLMDFIKVIETILDGEHDENRLREVCDNLIIKIIHGICYSKAIERNALNQELQESLDILDNFIIKNKEQLPETVQMEIDEEYETVDVWRKRKDGNVKVEVLKPKHTETQISVVEKAKRFAKIFEKILKQKDMPQLIKKQPTKKEKELQI